MLSLESVYPPAHQLALDMLKVKYNHEVNVKWISQKVNKVKVKICPKIPTVTLHSIVFNKHPVLILELHVSFSQANFIF